MSRTKKKPQMVSGKECVCGSRAFTIDNMTITIEDAPAMLDEDGYFQYDDTKGGSSGWDRIDDDRITCARPRCKKRYRIEGNDEDTELILQDERGKDVEVED